MNAAPNLLIDFMMTTGSLNCQCAHTKSVHAPTYIHTAHSDTQKENPMNTVYLLIYRTLLITRTLFWAIFVVLIQRTLQYFNITFVLNIRTIP